VTTVVGLDLSLTASGVCHIVDGEITLNTVRSKPKPKATLADQVERLAWIRDNIADLCDGAHLVLVEGPSYGSKGASVHQIAGNWWLIVDQLVERGIPVGVAPPSVVKKWATNRGNADKTAVGIAMARLWPTITPGNDNEVDALAIATMAAQRAGMAVPTRAHHADALTKAAWPNEIGTPA
jgi:crossover junction endodeoxyribonuclease RuvC